MAVFISYSRSDSDFVDRLASQLVANRVHVWIDRWELSVGDSLVDRIQEAIGEASALLVILSRSSVQSEWCRRELNAGLIRELEEKRVVVLPVVIDDCEVPLFLREKLYSDFRTDSDRGLQQILETLSQYSTAWMARVEGPQWHTDWGIDWGDVDGRFWVKIVMVEQAASQPYSALSEVRVVTDAETLRQYQSATTQDQIDAIVDGVIGALATAIEAGLELRFLLTDNFPQVATFPLSTATAGHRWVVTTTARRLGTDTGKDVVLHLDQQIGEIHRHVLQAHGSQNRRE